MSHQQEIHNKNWLDFLTRVQALAQTGLTFCADPFCYERYQELQALVNKQLANFTEFSPEKITKLFAQEMGYPTPKLDVRGAVFQDDQILLVQEASDKLWTLPGGWADINLSAAECVVKEIYEESGYLTRAIKLAALYDKQKQDHPYQIPHAYKCFFICEILDFKPHENIETIAAEFFTLNELPELSIHRITLKQIEKMFMHYRDLSLPTEFD